MVRGLKGHTIAEINGRVEVAFGTAPSKPPITLRGGDAIDVYDLPPPFDAKLDEPSDAYLDRYADGLGHLDPDSWLFYLPLFLNAALRSATEPGSRIVDALLWSLRPPDRDPPRLERLSSNQVAVVTDVLEFLAFSDDSLNQDYAMQVLEEYWIEDALYRHD